MKFSETVEEEEVISLFVEVAQPLADKTVFYQSFQKTKRQTGGVRQKRTGLWLVNLGVSLADEKLSPFLQGDVAISFKI